MPESKRTLYAFYGRPSSNPIKIAILLEELGLEYTISSLDRTSGEHQKAEHTKRHPNSKVPVLIDVNGVTTWETLAIALYLLEEYDKNRTLYSVDRQEKADMIAWYSLQSTALAPCAHYYLGKRDVPEMQLSRPFFRSEVLRLLAVLNSHLAVSKSGYMCPHGYSFVDAGWVVYSDHYIQNGIGFGLDEFPYVKVWHERIYQRPAVQRAYRKLGITILPTETT